MNKGKAAVIALALTIILPAALVAGVQPPSQYAPEPPGNSPHSGIGVLTPPEPPVPLRPEPGAKSNNTHPQLAVSEYLGAECYEFAVWYEDGNVEVAHGTSELPEWDVAGFAQGLPWGTYSWSCRVFDGTAWSEYFAPFWTFTIQKDEPPDNPPPPPIPVAPPDGSKGPRLRPELRVMAPIGSALLHFRVRRGDGAEIVSEGLTSEAAWLLTTMTPDPGCDVYSWSCRCFANGEWSDWFEPWWTFEIEKPPFDGTAEKRKVHRAEDTRFAPDPFGDDGSVYRMVMPAAGSASLTLYSADGRPVRTLASGQLAAGEHVFHWNGTDDSGNKVGAGTYLCRICTEAFTKTVKVTKAR